MAYSGMFSNIGLEQLRRALHTFALEQDWQDAHTPRNLVMALVHEAGELAGVYRWKGDGAASCLTASEKRRVTHELSELLLYLIRLSDVCGVDLGRAALDKLAANAAKFPKAGPPPGSGGAAAEEQHAGMGQQPPPPPPPPPTGQPGARARISLSAGLEDIMHGSPLSSPLRQPLDPQQAHASSRPRSSSSGSSSHGTPAPTAAAFIAGLPGTSRQHASHVAGRPPTGQSSPGTAALLAAMQAHSSPPSLSLAGHQQMQPQPPPPPPPPQQPPPPPPPERPAFAAMPSSSAVEEELMHVGNAAGLLPQGLLAEIEHGLDDTSCSGGGHAASGSGSSSTAQLGADGGTLAPPAPAPVTPASDSSGMLSPGPAVSAPAGGGGLWLSSGLQGCLSSNSTGGGQLDVMPCGSVGSTTAPSAAGSSVWLFPTSSHDHSTASAPSTVGEESELDSECSHPGASGRAGAATLAAIVAARAKCACCGRDAHAGDCLAALCGEAGAAMAPGKCAAAAAPSSRSLSASTARDAPAGALQPSRADYGVHPTFSV